MHISGIQGVGLCSRVFALRSPCRGNHTATNQERSNDDTKNSWPLSRHSRISGCRVADRASRRSGSRRRRTTRKYRSCWKTSKGKRPTCSVIRTSWSRSRDPTCHGRAMPKNWIGSKSASTLSGKPSASCKICGATPRLGSERQSTESCRWQRSWPRTPPQRSST